MNPDLVPIITFVGKSGTGKTTLLEQLIPMLKARGLRLAVLKHDAHHFEMDKPGKDTYRFTAAGADVVTISNAEKFAMIEQPPEELSLRDIISRLPQVDLVLTEGYKKSRYPKIEIHRAELHRPLLADPNELLAHFNRRAGGFPRAAAGPFGSEWLRSGNSAILPRLFRTIIKNGNRMRLCTPIPGLYIH